MWGLVPVGALGGTSLPDCFLGLGLVLALGFGGFGVGVGVEPSGTKAF